ncbi:DUF481 domain-containing protein [uncultured Algibacter sp.]|jgi:hypothetical protein|uniref:DUF481 domain-containing protein n=1 Tax=uncultured Algibacter sp. TaxID=298659 RepID=UPI0025EFE69F|nr:DUF481 domain-containing protein [uncultured Algibacter sp.]MDC1198064.1 DUF481 domain-containing protein [Algibacter sp.]
MKKILYYFLFLPIFLSAQINESDTLNLKANLSLTGFYQGGNVETLIFRAKSDLSFKPLKKWVFKTKNSYVYQEFGKKKADEDILSLNFLYFNPERKIYPLLLGFVSTNFRREINLRYLLGAGVTYQILNKKNNWLKLAISSEYEQTDFGKGNFNLSEYNGNKSLNTFRGTIWVNGKYHLFKKKVIVNHEFYFQPSLEQSNNFRWQADAGLELPIWEFLNFKINYLHTFESVVIENQKREDNILTFGFTLKSY